MEKILDGSNSTETTKSEAKKWHNKLTWKDIDALEREKNDESNKIGGIRKNNMLNILKNITSIFTGAYLNYKNVPKETIFERSIAEKK